MNAPVYVCERVLDMPIPAVPSAEGHCTICGAGVWVDERALGVAEAMTIACCRCLEQQVNPGKAAG